MMCLFQRFPAFKEANIQKLIQGQAMEYVIADPEGKVVATQLKLVEKATNETLLNPNTELHNTGGLWQKK